VTDPDRLIRLAEDLERRYLLPPPAVDPEPLDDALAARLASQPIPPHVRDLLRTYMIPTAPGATPADLAFIELCGRAEHFNSLADLVRHAGRPLLGIRCAERGHGTLLAAVWNTSAGPLLVTAHRPETWSPADRDGMGRMGKSETRRSWTPRVALLGDSLDRILPLPCPKCRKPRPLTAEELGLALGDAVTSAPRDIRT
jgi:hypothetical protein